MRTYRCMKCKMVTREVPRNAYRVQCRNCLNVCTLKDVSDHEMID